MAPSPGAPQTSGATTMSGGSKRKHDHKDHNVDQTPTEKKRKSTRKQCIICTNNIRKNQFPKLPHARVDNDVHESDVCFKCYRDYLRFEVKGKRHEAVSCPQCSKPLEHFEVRKLASSDTYKEYDNKAAREYMQQEEEFHACPNANCSWGAFFDKGDGNILNCQACSARYCLSCQVIFHEGQKCEEYQAVARQRSEDEQRSADAVQRLSRPCPGPGCGINIDKFEGCDHVTCSRCDHEFCWECFAPYLGTSGIEEIGNDAHKVTCKHHPDRLPTYHPLSDDELDQEEDVSDDDLW